MKILLSEVPCFYSLKIFFQLSLFSLFKSCLVLLFPLVRPLLYLAMLLRNISLDQCPIFYSLSSILHFTNMRPVLG